MGKTMIEIDNSQLMFALEQLPSEDLKKMIDTLILKKLFKKPNFEEVAKKARKNITKRNLKPEVIEEAIQWARKQK